MLYYIAIQDAYGDVIYIYRTEEPKLNSTIYHNGKNYKIVGYMQA